METSLYAEIIVYGDRNLLLRPQIPLGGLDRRISQEELDLLEIPGRLLGQVLRRS